MSFFVAMSLLFAVLSSCANQMIDQAECYVLYSFNLHMATPIVCNQICIKSASSITLPASGLTQPPHACSIAEPGNILPVGEREMFQFGITQNDDVR